EAQLESQCKNLRLALSELELKYSHNEQQRTDLERKLKDAEEQNALQFGLLTDSRKNMQAQQGILEALEEKSQQMSSRLSTVSI
uniref:CENPF protein n=1 Tax=Mesocestoides corti TaxID=53468 RepID=A0A5K3FMS3_MESCO